MPKEQNLSIPIAIVVAGALIAVAIFFASRSAEPKTPTTSPPETGVKTFVPVSASDHILGSPDAPVIIVEYTDLECPFCKQFHGTMQQVMSTYGKDGRVAWIIRNFPLSQLHPNAPKLAEAAECIANLGGSNAYFSFINSVFTIAPAGTFFDMTKLAGTAKSAGVAEAAFNTCLSSGTYQNKVQKEYNDAIAAGGGGTPYSIFVLKNKLPALGKNTITALAAQFQPGTITISQDEKKISMSGALSYDSVKSVIDAALQ